MASVNFLYRSSKPEAFLNLRLLYRIKDKTDPSAFKDYVIGCNTSLKVSKNYWKNQHHLKRVKDVQVKNLQATINKEIARISSHVLLAFETSNGVGIDKAWLSKTIDLYYNPQQEKPYPKNLLSYIDYYIEERRFEVSVTSIRKFNVVKEKLKRMQEQRGRPIMISEVGEDFKKELAEYYEREKYSPNTAQRELGTIKAFCKHAKKKGLEVHPELYDIKLKKRPVKKIYLSFDELERIENAAMEHEYQENARDWLIISCYTGQRISDFMRFNSDMIRVESGKQLLEFKQVKTKKQMTIPVHPKVAAILEKRNGEFPRATSDQRYNEYIKEVCMLSGINEMVHGKKAIDLEPGKDKAKIRAIEGEYEKWELATSHVGRRSFASNFYGYNNIPTSYLIYVTGHSSEAMFLNYIGKSNKDLAMELTNYF